MIMSKFPILRRFQCNLQGTIGPPTSRGPRHLRRCPDPRLPASSLRWSGRITVTTFTAFLKWAYGYSPDALLQPTRRYSTEQN